MINYELLKLEQQCYKTVECGINGLDRAQVFDKKKFAELIINQCAEIADKNSPLSYPDHGIKIKRYFGLD